MNLSNAECVDLGIDLFVGGSEVVEGLGPLFETTPTGSVVAVDAAFECLLGEFHLSSRDVPES